MKILVVYELVPEQTKCYLVDFSEEQFKEFSVLAGKYWNSDDLSTTEEMAADKLTDLLVKMHPKTPQELLTLKVDGILLWGFIL